MTDRRSRLLRFIKPFSDGSPDLYRPRIGYEAEGYVLALDDLTDDALEGLAESICVDFWITKRRNRSARQERKNA